MVLYFNFQNNFNDFLNQKYSRVTATKYSDMQQITANIAKGINQLNEKYRELQPYLEQIDQVFISFQIQDNGRRVYLKILVNFEYRILLVTKDEPDGYRLLCFIL